MSLLDRLFGRSRDRRPSGSGAAVPETDTDVADDVDLDLEEGAVDPDELEAESFAWDDGTDDEVG